MWPRNEMKGKEFGRGKVLYCGGRKVEDMEQRVRTGKEENEDRKEAEYGEGREWKGKRIRAVEVAGN